MSKIVDKNMLADTNNDVSEIVYYDAKDECFMSYGYDKNEVSNYQRLSEDELSLFKPINDCVFYHGNNSAGIHIMFETDSLNIMLQAKIHDDFRLPNMSNYGQSAFSLYIYNNKVKQYVLYNISKFAYRELSFEVSLAKFTNKKMRKFILYFPLYSSIDVAKIGFDKNATIKPINHKDNRRICIYGTSITQGCDASNGGICYTNIISRKLDANVYNYGFSGGAMLEREMANIIASKNFDLLVIDVEANAGCNDTLKDRLHDFLDIIFMVNKNAKVMLCSRVYYSLDISDKEVYDRHKYYLKYQENVVNEYKEKGYNICYLDGSKVIKLNEISFAVDGVHPDSYVFNKIANAMVKKINKEF